MRTRAEDQPTAQARPARRRHRTRASGLASATILVAASAALSTASAPTAANATAVPSGGRAWSEASIASTTYDLGVRDFPQPLEGDLARMPIRLWGSISVPDGAGPFPVVVIVHGAHGDNCPAGELDGETWPCFDTERRSDLGLDHLGRAVARAGAIAVVPNVNAAYSGGWGEGANLERLRFRQVVESTLAELARAGTGTADAFDGLALAGRVDLGRLGVVGHSRGGYNAVAWTRRATSAYPASSLFLLAPYLKGRTVADVPLTVAVGTCDGDTGDSGLSYVTAARSDAGRTTPTVTLRVAGANHNNYNRTLVAEGLDDADPSARGCRRAQRPRPGAQQRWLRTVVVDHLAATLLSPRERASYLRGNRQRTTTIEGLSTRVQRWRPRA